MKIQTIPNINFKSDYYGFRKDKHNYDLLSIMTDDPPAENKELLLRVKDYADRIHDFPMTYDGKYYTYINNPNRITTSYEILNKKEPQGEKELDNFVISIQLEKYSKLSTGRPAEKVVSKGSAEGILVTDLNNIPSDKPVVLMIDKMEDDKIVNEIIPILGTNVHGIIINNVRIGDLTHGANLARDYYDIVSVVYDSEKYNDLKKLAGENIHISNKSGEIEYSKIDKLPNLKIDQRNIPNIPILENETKLLDFSELTRKNSGEKAYRLGVMQKLINDGYLSDVTVPKGFVIPVGYINKIYEYINESDDELERERRIMEHPLNAELGRVCESYGLKENYIIIRSAFNAEDLPDYTVAGIYDSMRCSRYKYLVDMINSVVTSKDDKRAKKSRERYGIEDAVIQPCVIVQERIVPQYPFTLYTDSSDGKLKIETHSRSEENEDVLISYDKETEELKIESLPYSYGNYIIKDTGEIVEQHFKQNQIEKDWSSLIEPLKIAIKNALKLEKYFGKPQDIEGGILNGKVYFWQTRDIIKKAVKR